MKKSVKAASAAGVATVLLMGGAGSLAYWTSSNTASAGSVTAGSLAFTGGGCDASWKYSTGATNAGATVTGFVPGDKVTKTCTATVAVTGDNIVGVVNTPTSLTYTQSGTNNSFKLTNTVGYTVTRASGSATRSLPNGGTITSADDGATITATFNVTIPYGNTTNGTGGISANDTQGITATLDTATIAITQSNPNA